MSEKEKILLSKLDEKELQEVVGGCGTKHLDYDTDHCVDNHYRRIYGDNNESFPYCAATVEEWSWCDLNDACYDDAIRYLNMKSCDKAWE